MAKLKTVKQIQNCIYQAFEEINKDLLKKRIDISCGDHLGVIVRKTSIAWVSVYKVKGKSPTKEVIESLKKITDIDAQSLSRIHKIAINKFKSAQSNNNDPILSREIPTFEQYCKIYCDRFIPNPNKVKSNKGNSRYQNIKSALGHFKYLSKHKINNIEPNIVDYALDQDDASSTKDISQKAKRNAIEELRRMLDAAVGDTLLEDNPLKNMLKGKSRFAEKYAGKDSDSKIPIPFDKLSWFYEQVMHLEEINIIASILQNLTCLRITEIGSLEWSWINYNEKKLSIPEGIMKMARPFNVPLSAFSISVLKYWQNECMNNNINSKYVFFSKSSIKRNRLGKTFIVDLHSVVYGKYTYHSIRRTFTTWATGLLVPEEIRATFISHLMKSHDPSERYYNFQDFFNARTKLMEIWNFKLYSFMEPYFKKYFQFVKDCDLEYAQSLINQYKKNPKTFFLDNI